MSGDFVANGRNAGKAAKLVDERQMFVVWWYCSGALWKRACFYVYGSQSGGQPKPDEYRAMVLLRKKELALNCCIYLLHQLRANSHRSCYLASVWNLSFYSIQFCKCFDETFPSFWNPIQNICFICIFIFYSWASCLHVGGFLMIYFISSFRFNH